MLEMKQSHNTYKKKVQSGNSFQTSIDPNLAKEEKKQQHNINDNAKCNNKNANINHNSNSNIIIINTNKGKKYLTKVDDGIGCVTEKQEPFLLDDRHLHNHQPTLHANHTTNQNPPLPNIDPQTTFESSSFHHHQEQRTQLEVQAIETSNCSQSHSRHSSNRLSAVDLKSNPLPSQPKRNTQQEQEKSHSSKNQQQKQNPLKFSSPQLDSSSVNRSGNTTFSNSNSSLSRTYLTGNNNTVINNNNNNNRPESSDANFQFLLLGPCPNFDLIHSSSFSSPLKRSSVHSSILQLNNTPNSLFSSKHSATSYSSVSSSPISNARSAVSPNCSNSTQTLRRRDSTLLKQQLNKPLPPLPPTSPSLPNLPDSQNFAVAAARQLDLQSRTLNTRASFLHSSVSISSGSTVLRKTKSSSSLSSRTCSNSALSTSSPILKSHDGSFSSISQKKRRRKKLENTSYNTCKESVTNTTPTDNTDIDNSSRAKVNTKLRKNRLSVFIQNQDLIGFTNNRNRLSSTTNLNSKSKSEPKILTSDSFDKLESDTTYNHSSNNSNKKKNLGPSSEEESPELTTSMSPMLSSSSNASSHGNLASNSTMSLKAKRPHFFRRLFGGLSGHTSSSNHNENALTSTKSNKSTCTTTSIQDNVLTPESTTNKSHSSPDDIVSYHFIYSFLF